MFRRKLSNFIRNNIDKIRDVGTKLMIVAIVVFIATIMLSVNRAEKDLNKEDNNDLYKPTQTIIKGQNVSEKQYVRDFNIVNNFLEFCNSGNIENAYSLITKECKEEKYPNIEYFKEHYYNMIFNKKREYSLQAWISTSAYTVYKIRYTNSLLSTGTYNEEDIYEDYITLDKNSNLGQISIGNFVMSKSCNIQTSTNDIEATVIKKTVYISEEEYEIKIKNNTNKTILLDTLEDGQGIKLLGNGVEHNIYINGIFVENLKIASGETKIINLRFYKNLSSNNKSKKINFSRIIKEYDEYEKDKKEYNDIIKLDVRVEE